MTDVDVHEAARRAEQGAVLLDVREPDEWEQGRIEGARHLPLGELDAASLDVPLGTPIVAVCRSGNRSGKATAALEGAGHDVVNMAGGMLAWSEAGLPMIVGP